MDSNYWSRHGEIPLGRAMWFPRTAPPALRGTDPERGEKFESLFLQQRVGHEPHGQNRTRSRPEPKVRIQLSPAVTRVSCRRSASPDFTPERDAESEPASDGRPIDVDAPGHRAAIASSSLRRSPTKETPRSFRSSAVRLGSTSASILFARNTGSYCSSPRRLSQAAMSTTASPDRSHSRIG
jgi:hypothetical protein